MSTTPKTVMPRELRRGVVFVVSMLLAAAGCGPLALAARAQEAAAGPEPAAQSAAAPGEEATEVAVEPDEDESDAAELFTDEDGQQYRLERIPKEDLGKFERLEGNRLRTPWGFTISYEREDEEAFYIRHYVIDYEVPNPHAPPTAAELEAVAQTYRFELAEDDRLTFLAFDEGLPREGQWRQGFDVADMNGDGHLDLVHGPPRGLGGFPVIFLGDGAGSWRLWEAEYPNASYDYGDAAAADFDGDGRLDLALGNHLRGQLVLVQREPGRFVLWGDGLDFVVAQAKEQQLFSSRALDVADWDGDGRVDLLALGEGPRLPKVGAKVSPTEGSYGLVLYRNLGGGHWERKDSGTTPEEGFGDALEVGDFNGDGRPDVLRGSFLAGQRSLLYLGTGDLWQITALENVRPFAYIRDVAVADFDRDGRLDFALSYAAYELDRWRTGIDLFLGEKAAGSWKRRTVFAEEGSQGIWALASGDLQGDGWSDLVALTGDGQVMVLLGGEGGFVREHQSLLEPIVGCRGYTVRLADLDGDGRDEIAAEFSGGSTTLFTGARVPGCPGQGSLRAWKAVDKEPASSSPSSGS